MPAKDKLSTSERGYGARHQAIRARQEPVVLAGGVRCAKCGDLIRPGEPWDLGHGDSKREYVGPEHSRCNRSVGGRIGGRMRGQQQTQEKLRREGRWVPPPVELAQERPGVPAADGRWDVPWLAEFRRVPADATWPRYMTVPHPRAVGSIGDEFIADAEGREGRPLRWWQRLVGVRLLEVDAAGRLCWETMLLTMARQLGKSWLLRELFLWRMHQADRFGEPQTVLHTGKDLQVLKEIFWPALYWAEKQKPKYKVAKSTGEMTIELVENHSRWLMRSKHAVYGYSSSLAAVDEAWKVPPEIVDEGVTPTMVEREQPQQLLVSTAHREATALMLGRRKVALEHLESGDGDLLIEWSAPRDADLDDVAAWRLASPHWTAQRQRLISRQLEAVRAGEAEVVEDEADPVEAFAAQWLNRWPDRAVPIGTGEPLLPAGLWDWLRQPGLGGDGELFVALEDDFGRGAAIAAVAQLEDGRLEVDGWTCEDWDTAILEVQRLGVVRRVRQLLVGASLLSRVPPGMVPPAKPAGGAETRLGLPLLRDLAAAGQVVHDDTTVELDEAVGQAQVKTLQTGLSLQPTGSSHLVKALVWAVGAAHKPAPTPAIH